MERDGSSISKDSDEAIHYTLSVSVDAKRKQEERRSAKLERFSSPRVDPSLSERTYRRGVRCIRPRGEERTMSAA